MATIKKRIKVLSVNDAFQGRRFKTPKYKAYEQELLYTLPRIKLPEPPFEVWYEFGMSNSLSDFDNPVKPLTDIMQKKYGFNDKDIIKAHIDKVKVKKGDEYFEIKIESLMTNRELKEVLNLVNSAIDSLLEDFAKDRIGKQLFLERHAQLMESRKKLVDSYFERK